MGGEERRRRMGQLRRVVEEHNIYWWAAKFLTELAATSSPRAGPQETGTEELASEGVLVGTPAVQVQDPGGHASSRERPVGQDR